MTSHNLLLELLVQELPPKALPRLGEAFAALLGEGLRAQGLASAASVITSFATPRRLAAHISGVLAQAADQALRCKLMPVGVGLDARGRATPALRKKLQALGADPDAAVATLDRARDGKAEFLFYDSVVAGATLAQGLQKTLDETIAKLPAPTLMRYQLQSDCELPGWTSVHFVRPAQGLVALHGGSVVPVRALGLQAGRLTQGHRFEAAVSPLPLPDADSYADTLRTHGAVIASFAERRADIARQLAAAAAQVGPGVRAIDDAALLDEVSALVERPKVLLCAFEPRFLDMPQECLILTMKSQQKYFPLLDAQGRLTHQFLVVSNIDPQDASLVIGGNERVVRPRLADAQFFYDQDRKKTLAERVPELDNMVYHHQLGTQGQRVQRVRNLAGFIARRLGDKAFQAQVDQAAQLAKADLLSAMVGEFPELQGVMGRCYAQCEGLDAEVAQAIEDHYKPRFAGDGLPRNRVALVLALADKLETLVGMFGIGNQPSGDRDPFALRRQALGLIRILVEKDLPLELGTLLENALTTFSLAILTGPGSPVFCDFRNPSAALTDFIYERLSGSLREQGYGAQEIDAVLALRPQRLAEVEKRLAAVRAFAALPESPALAAANKRIGNILKKADAVDPHVNPELLREQAEQDLYAALQRFVPEADAQFDAGDYTASLQTLAVLRAPVDAFFDDVMVNAEQMDLRLNRQGLLQSLHRAMNRVADLSRLAV